MSIFTKYKLSGRFVGFPETISTGVSFESGEQSTLKLYFPYPVRVTAIRAFVTKAVAATDAGTITGSNSSGNSTGGAISVPASTAINTEFTATPTTNTTVPAGSYYQLTTAKTTAGGKVHISIETVRI